METLETMRKERNQLLVQIENMERQIKAAEAILEENGLYNQYERESRPFFDPVL